MSANHFSIIVLDALQILVCGNCQRFEEKKVVVPVVITSTRTCRTSAIASGSEADHDPITVINKHGVDDPNINARCTNTTGLTILGRIQPHIVGHHFHVPTNHRRSGLDFGIDLFHWLACADRHFIKLAAAAAAARSDRPLLVFTMTRVTLCPPDVVAVACDALFA